MIGRSPEVTNFNWLFAKILPDHLDLTVGSSQIDIGHNNVFINLKYSKVSQSKNQRVSKTRVFRKWTNVIMASGDATRVVDI